MKKTLLVCLIAGTLIAGCTAHLVDNVADDYGQYEKGTDAYCEMVLDPLIESGDADTLEALGEDALADSIRNNK